MAWYRTGTIAVTNGSPIVTGTGTAFVANVQIGHAINLPDGRAYEVLNVQSDTQLVLGSNFFGATAGGQAYSIQPNQGFAQRAASMLADFIAQFSGYLTTALAGRFGDGSAALPGIAFSGDQDTGIFRFGENQIGLVAGGVRRLGVTAAGITVTGNTELYADEFPIVAYGRNNIGTWYTGGYQAGQNSWNLRFNGLPPYIAVTNDGNVGIGVIAPAAKLYVYAGSSSVATFQNAASPGTRLQFLDTNYAAEIEHNSGSLRFKYNGTTEGFRLENGNLLVGVTTGSEHTFSKPVAQASAIVRVYGSAGAGGTSLAVASVNSYNPSGAGAAVYVGQNTTTNRSINAGGTINASGADYAEYMTKAPGCGLIAKGDVCGVDDAGQLTRSWADAILFKIKSTDPNLVGGDTYSAHLGERPAAPLLELPVYDGPPEPVVPTAPVAPQPVTDRPVEPIREDGEEDIDFIRRMAAFLVENAAWVANAATYQDASTAYALAMQAYQAAMDIYTADLSAYATARAAHDTAVAQAEAAHDAALAQHEVDLAAFEQALEAARLGVDRIAYCGRVPVNFAGACQPGDYLVAIANGGGIGLKAVAEADITFADYRRRVGRVLSIGADARPIVDVAQG